MNPSHSVSSKLSMYSRMKTLPGLLSVGFVLTSLYQFGGIGAISFNWINYTLGDGPTALISMGILLAAFMSSETKQFDNYEDWEKVLIAAAPVLIVGEAYTAQVTDFITSLGDPLGMQLAFVVTILSWGVAVQ